MNTFNLWQEELVCADILTGESSEFAIFAIENFARIVDSRLQNDLFRNLILSHAEIARELEKTNAQLLESEALLSEAQQIARIGRWDIDYRADKRYWSESFYDILQFDPSVTPSSELFMQRIHPDDLAQTMQIAEELRSRHGAWTDRYRVAMPDGSTRWMHVRMYTEFDEENQPVRSYGTLQDITAMKEAEDELERYSKQLEEMVSEKVKEISESQMATIFALVKLAESRDDETGAHIERTASFCRLLAQKARTLPQFHGLIDDEYVATIYRASPLHDIGKVGISDLILLKPGKLTPEEFAVMKTHVEIGYQTLSNIDKRYQNNAFVQMGLDITRFHHEKWDGSGYLFELQGEEIPLSARIMALADVYDALRSKRVYKPAFSHEKAMEIIVEGRGKHFDPALVDLFAAFHHEFETLYDQLS